MSDYIAELQAVFMKLHNCDADYVETVPVVEKFKVKRFFRATLRYSTYAGIRRPHAAMVGDTLQPKAVGGATSQS